MASRKDPERQPLLRSYSSRHGTTAPRGESTLLHTVFNSTNVLLGVGLLSLPLAVKSAGWIIGIGLLTFSAVVTAYTARLLARCLDYDKTLVTYADLAYASYGSRACNVTRVLFSFMMVAASVALTILFGDIMHLLIPSLSGLQWKLVCGIVLIPLQFLPFSLLSFASLIGVIASVGLVLLTILSGICKDYSPGSLRQPASTTLFPRSWTTVPLSIGLFMAPWGGHGSFPSLYRDMRDPKQYNESLLISFPVTYILDLSMAVCGYLMYGMDTRDEIIANILVTPGYPHALLIIIVALVAVMPVTKIPLSSRPLTMMIEGLIGLTPESPSESSSSSSQQSSGRSSATNHILRCTLRVLVVATIVGVSIICPNFDSVMAFAGSALCFTICVILPLLFYTKLYAGHISLTERVIDWSLIVIATILALLGTVWACLPRDTFSGLAVPST